MAKAGRKEEARRWISQAIFDLKGAEWNLEGRFFNTVCFLAQIDEINQMNQTNQIDQTDQIDRCPLMGDIQIRILE